MASSNIRLSSTPTSFARVVSPLVRALQTVVVNVFSILEVLLRVREIHQNGQKMADMLREADRLQAQSPLRAEALRREAHRIALV
jgi:hypothetical protein